MESPIPKNINLIDLVKGLMRTAKSNVILLLILAVVCIGSAFLYCAQQKPYFEYELIYKTHRTSNPDVYLLLKDVEKKSSDAALTAQLINYDQMNNTRAIDVSRL